MAQSAPALQHLLPGRSGPAIIAHGGGNSLDRVRDYVAAGADYLEVDLWLHRGRFEARHERRVRLLPLLFEKWYLRRVPSPHYGLAELLEAAAGSSAGIFLDLKNGGASAAEALAAVIAGTEHQPRIIASSQQWKALRAIAERLPAVDTFYSIDVRAKLDLFLSVSDRDMRPRGVSCRHTLLTGPIVRQLIDRGLLVVAWTVDDIERARELAGWGVHGLTTHRVAGMHAALGNLL
jgi:glycerophosphoryl diester phosphodiesterase